MENGEMHLEFNASDKIEGTFGKGSGKMEEFVSEKTEEEAMGNGKMQEFTASQKNEKSFETVDKEIVHDLDVSLKAEELESDDESVDGSDKALLMREEKSPTKSSCLVGINWKNVLAAVYLWMAFALCSAAFSIMSPFFPQEALLKGASPAIIGVIISSAPLTVAVLSPVLGYLLPLLGIPTYILAGLLIVGASYVSLGFVLRIPWTWAFITVCVLLRVAEGAGTAMLYTGTFATFPKLFPNSVSLLMGLFEVAIGLGYTLGRPIGGLLFTAGGYMVPFVTIGASTMLISIPSTLFLLRVQIERKKEKSFLSWRVVLSIATDLYFIVLALGILAGFSTGSNQGPVLQPFLIEKFQLNALQVCLVYVCLAVAFTATNLPAGLISNKLNNVYIIVFGLMVATIGEFILGLQDYIETWKVWIVCVSLVVIGIGGAIAIVPVYANLIRVAERYIDVNGDSRGALISFISGIVSSSVSLGQFSGPLLAGVLTNFLSFPIASLLIGQLVLAEALLLLGVHVIDVYT